MKMRAVFTVFARKLESGRKVYYYHTYNEKGVRTAMHSTGQKTKTAAVAFCMELYRAGKLIPAKTKAPTFAEFAKGWWDYDTCEYIQRQKTRRPMARGSAELGAISTRTHLIPEFGDMRLDGISATGVDDWLTGFKRRCLSNATGNNAFKFLKIMLGEAVRLEIMSLPAASAQTSLRSPTGAVSCKRCIIYEARSARKFINRGVYYHIFCWCYQI